MAYQDQDWDHDRMKADSEDQIHVQIQGEATEEGRAEARTSDFKAEPQTKTKIEAAVGPMSVSTSTWRSLV